MLSTYKNRLTVKVVSHVLFLPLFVILPTVAFRGSNHHGILPRVTAAWGMAESVTFAPPVETSPDIITETLSRDERTKETVAPRTARRMNHAFRYLYRHIDYGVNLTSLDYLTRYGGYTEYQLFEMNRTFPPLLELDVRRHLGPKMCFLKETMGLVDDDNNLLLEDLRKHNRIPPHYFGARLERTIAPRHAFLVFFNLPHGRDLFTESITMTGRNHDDRTLWEQFLMECRNTKRFAALCTNWRKQCIIRNYSKDSTSIDNIQNTSTITPKQVEAFDALFSRGLMAAARDELCQWNNTWPLQHVNITSAEMARLLIQHGANPLERDVRGATLLHWASGTGNLETVKELFPHFVDGAFTESERDSATPMHWAAAGANAREFGVGGHSEVCHYLLSQVPTRDRKRLVNALTKCGNSALMWAAWSGTLETVKLLVRNRADTTLSNQNGCTVAHWAASGGNVEVCKYLASTVNVDFRTPNHGGNTPLTHAVAFGRVEVVDWLRSELKDAFDDSSAADLAWDFVDWTDGDEKRQQVFQLFEEWHSHNR